jgi:hypothetical protein
MWPASMEQLSLTGARPSWQQEQRQFSTQALSVLRRVSLSYQSQPAEARQPLSTGRLGGRTFFDSGIYCSALVSVDMDTLDQRAPLARFSRETATW